MDGHGAGLPGVSEPADGRKRIVLHVDMDCFYASCERRREPELAGEPVVVGMGYEPGSDRGAVATASYEARAVGVESAQAISVALERLPNRETTVLEPEADSNVDGADAERAETGYYRPVDMSYYESVSEEVRSILRECADTVREVSIDEAYLDVTSRTSWDRIDDPDDADGPHNPDGSDERAVAASTGAGSRTLAEGFARHVKRRIAREVEVTASIGVAPNMSTAKIASDYDKPDGLVVVPPGGIREFLAPLDVEVVHGIGPVTARDLRGDGIETAGDLAAADPRRLEERFGTRGRELYRRARGEDDREVTPTGRPKSLNRESAFEEATAEAERHREKVRTLAASVAERAEQENALYRTIGIKVVTPPFEINTRARSLPGPVRDGALIEDVALDLLEEFDGERIRKLGVRVSNLEFAAGGQSNLDGWDDDSAPGTTVEDDTRRRSDGRTADGADQASLTDFSG